MSYANRERPTRSESKSAKSTPVESARMRSDTGGARKWDETVDDRGVTFLKCRKVAISEQSVRAKRHEFRRPTDLD